MITLARLLGIGLGLLLGMVLHEFAHALASDRLGDRTPRMAGRLTLNPVPHIDPVGTVAMPALFLIVSLVGRPFGMIFGYAKPVPTNPRMLRNPRRDEVIVALAGPGMNLALAAAAGYGVRAMDPGVVLEALGAFVGAGSLTASSLLVLALLFATTVNVFLMIVNSLPIPPLDGSTVLGLFLSPRARFKMHELAQYSLLFVILLFFIFRGVLGAMADPVCRAFTGVPACVL